MIMRLNTDWYEEDGYHGHLHPLFGTDRDNGYTAENDTEDRFKVHLLLEFLDYLEILEYSKFYDSVYEIKIKQR